MSRRYGKCPYCDTEVSTVGSSTHVRKKHPDNYEEFRNDFENWKNSTFIKDSESGIPVNEPEPEVTTGSYDQTFIAEPVNVPEPEVTAETQDQTFIAEPVSVPEPEASTGIQEQPEDSQESTITPGARLSLIITEWKNRMDSEYYKLRSKSSHFLWNVRSKVTLISTKARSISYKQELKYRTKSSYWKLQSKTSPFLTKTRSKLTQISMNVRSSSYPQELKNRSNSLYFKIQSKLSLSLMKIKSSITDKLH